MNEKSVQIVGLDRPIELGSGVRITGKPDGTLLFEAITPDAPAAQAGVAPSERDWNDDASLYQNKCLTCGNHFYGQKRRPTCKVCAVEPAVSAEPVAWRYKMSCSACPDGVWVDELDTSMTLLETQALYTYPPVDTAGKLAQAEYELETERMRLAAVSTAALGYFEDCHDEYRSAALQDVLNLRKRYEDSAAVADKLAESLRAVLDKHIAPRCNEPWIEKARAALAEWQQKGGSV